MPIVRSLFPALAIALFGAGSVGCQQVDDRGTAIHSLMRAYEAKGLFSGQVLAAEGGEIVYQGAFGLADREWEVPNTMETLFRIASLTKAFTATLVLQLVEEGKVRLDGTIADYLPYYTGPAADRITVEQLLTHRSGIVGEWAVEDLDQIERHLWSKEDLLAHIAGYDLWFEPGARWGYSNFGYFLLGVIVERASGQSYAERLEDRICRPAGMGHTRPEVTNEVIPRRARGYNSFADRGIENATPLEMSFTFGGGHLLSTVEDLYRWDRALRGGIVLSPEHTRFILERAEERDPLGSARREVPVLRFGGRVNGFLSSTHSFTQDDRFVAVLANVKSPGTEAVPTTFQVARQIAAILYGFEYEMP